jgi:hypothetical protein
MSRNCRTPGGGELAHYVGDELPGKAGDQRHLGHDLAELLGQRAVRLEVILAPHPEVPDPRRARHCRVKGEHSRDVVFLRGALRHSVPTCRGTNVPPQMR